VSRGGVLIHLKCAPKTVSDRAHRKEHEHLDAYVAVAGVETLYQELQSRGARIIKPLGPQPWGHTCSPLGGQSANFNVLVGPDGSETVFTIPSGSVLVITAVDVLGFDAAPGAGIQTRLFRGVLGTGFSVFSLRESVAGPDGRIFHRYEFPSGVEVASAGLVCANSNNNDLVMSGFLYGFVK